MQNKAIFALLPLSLAACAPSGLQDTLFDRPVSSHIEDGNFGQATMTNTMVHSGAAEYRISLQRRFEAEAPSTVNFAFDSAALDAEARTALAQQAAWIRQFPEVRFKVYGHTDLVGSSAYNQRLGMRRAQAVVAYLISQGISRDRLEAVISEGQSQPLIVTEGRERRNRRTVTEVTGFVENHPMVLNGKYAEIIFREYVRSAAPRGQLQAVSVQQVATGN